MNNQIKELNVRTLKTYLKRLKSVTKGFTALIVRDPLDFLDFEVNSESYLNALVHSIGLGEYRPQKPYTHLTAKNKGINRPTVVFDMPDALVYRFCIGHIEDELLDAIRQKKCSWRY